MLRAEHQPIPNCPSDSSIACAIAKFIPSAPGAFSPSITQIAPNPEATLGLVLPFYHSNLDHLQVAWDFVELRESLRHGH